MSRFSQTIRTDCQPIHRFSVIFPGKSPEQYGGFTVTVVVEFHRTKQLPERDKRYFHTICTGHFLVIELFDLQIPPNNLDDSNQVQ